MQAYCKTPFKNLSGETPAKRCLVGVNSPLSCLVCHLQFASLQQLSLHMFMSHGMKSHIRLYIKTTYCSVCLKEFHSRERVLDHIRYRSAVCRANLMLRGPVLTEVEAATIDEESREEHRTLAHACRRRHHVHCPAIQLPGPLLPVDARSLIRIVAVTG